MKSVMLMQEQGLNVHKSIRYAGYVTVYPEKIYFNMKTIN